MFETSLETLTSESGNSSPGMASGSQFFVTFYSCRMILILPSTSFPHSRLKIEIERESAQVSIINATIEDKINATCDSKHSGYAALAMSWRGPLRPSSLQQVAVSKSTATWRLRCGVTPSIISSKSRCGKVNACRT
jgi:hypothetical protein